MSHQLTSKFNVYISYRYESTITAQFFGHTHYDEFELFYDVADLGRALSIAYVGPSVTPYYELNPGYRIYYVDGDHPKTTRVTYSITLFCYNRKILFYYNIQKSNKSIILCSRCKWFNFIH